MRVPLIKKSISRKRKSSKQLEILNKFYKSTIKWKRKNLRILAKEVDLDEN
jgi:hypothetical protein